MAALERRLCVRAEEISRLPDWLLLQSLSDLFPALSDLGAIVESSGFGSPQSSPLHHAKQAPASV